MRFLLYTFAALLTCLFWTSTPVFAEFFCARSMMYQHHEIPFDEVLSNKSGQKLLAAIPRISDRVWKRYWSSPEVNEITSQLLHNTEGISQTVRLEGVGWMLTKTLKMEDFLFLDLIHIQIKKETQTVAVGERTQGANSLFLKAMVGYLKAAYILKSKHPELSSIVIRGVNIKNPMLLQFLAENGFQRNDLHWNSKEMEKLIVF